MERCGCGARTMACNMDGNIYRCTICGTETIVRNNPDIDYRIIERRILSDDADAGDWINFYRHQRYRGNRNYRCGCAQFHQIEPCQILGCISSIPRFFCGDEKCALCNACNSTSHSIHYECDRCSRRGCQFHFQECAECEFRGWRS